MILTRTDGIAPFKLIRNAAFVVRQPSCRSLPKDTSAHYDHRGTSTQPSWGGCLAAANNQHNESQDRNPRRRRNAHYPLHPKFWHNFAPKLLLISVLPFRGEFSSRNDDQSATNRCDTTVESQVCSSDDWMSNSSVEQCYEVRSLTFDQSAGPRQHNRYCHSAQYT